MKKEFLSYQKIKHKYDHLTYKYRVKNIIMPFIIKKMAENYKKNFNLLNFSFDSNSRFKKIKKRLVVSYIICIQCYPIWL